MFNLDPPKIGSLWTNFSDMGSQKRQISACRWSWRHQGWIRPVTCCSLSLAIGLLHWQRETQQNNWEQRQAVKTRYLTCTFCTIVQISSSSLHSSKAHSGIFRMTGFHKYASAASCSIRNMCSLQICTNKWMLCADRNEATVHCGLLNWQAWVVSRNLTPRYATGPIL